MYALCEARTSPARCDGSFGEREQRLRDHVREAERAGRDVDHDHQPVAAAERGGDARRIGRPRRRAPARRRSRAPRATARASRVRRAAGARACASTLGIDERAERRGRPIRSRPDLDHRRSDPAVQCRPHLRREKRRAPRARAGAAPRRAPAFGARARAREPRPGASRGRRACAVGRLRRRCCAAASTRRSERSSGDSRCQRRRARSDGGQSAVTTSSCPGEPEHRRDQEEQQPKRLGRPCRIVGSSGGAVSTIPARVAGVAGEPRRELQRLPGHEHAGVPPSRAVGHGRRAGSERPGLRLSAAGRRASGTRARSGCAEARRRPG